MPRTKVSKSSKRNREAAIREEKIREFENTFEGFQNTLESLMQDHIKTYRQHFTMLLQRTSSALLQIKICDLFDMNLERFQDWEKQPKTLISQNGQNILGISHMSTSLRSSKLTNPNDEGYLTEDSSIGGGSLGGNSATNAPFLNASTLRPQILSTQQTARLRTPGPLSSARARRPRRSRSACASDYGITGSDIKSKSSVSKISSNANAGPEHNSRSKMRTPMATRTKALSCDRTPKVDIDNKSQNSPPAFLRFPKPGELVLSKCGSPLVANGIPGKFAHLNIPLRNGVISMQPKKFAVFKPELLDDMDSETLQQLRTLHANIDKIVSMANKAGL